MKFIQTLYFNKSINPFENTFGWVAPEYHLIGWALSCLQLQQLYTKVDLYCNNKAALLLKDQLGLPYTNVYETHDDLNIINEKLWALPKIFTYSLQNEPFLHLDGDVFLFKELPATLLGGGLIAQNVEEATEYYLSTQKELLAHFSYFPGCVKNDFDSMTPIKAVNAGIIGGSNISFIKEYATEAFEYIDRNTGYLSKINVDRFNVFFEQHLFYSLAAEKGLQIEVLIKEAIKDNRYLHLPDFHESPCKKNYMHLLGQYKKDEYTCRQMAAKLRQLYPKYYYRIVSLFKTEFTPLSISLYTEKRFATVADYMQFNEKTKKYLPVSSCNIDVLISNNREGLSIEKKEIITLALLKKTIAEVQHFASFTKAQIEDDFATFSKNLMQILQQYSKLPEEYIYGRDLESVNWFCVLFGNDPDTPDKMITRCNEVNIIKSGFNWAGLLNKHNRIGIKYYEVLELNPGEFYNLVIPEIFGDGFSLHDLEEVEKIILEQLRNPLSIKKLYDVMLAYAEEDIIENHLEAYQELIILMLKQLVLKKAIMPVKI